MLAAARTLDGALELLPGVTRMEMEDLLKECHSASALAIIEALRYKVNLRISQLEHLSAGAEELKYHHELVDFYDSFMELVSDRCARPVAHQARVADEQEEVTVHHQAVVSEEPA